MIISHKHRYLFVENPHTATTAISRELRDLYDGMPALRKHASYEEFSRIASPEEKRYFVFAGVRNPLDEAVTLYFKLKTNHGGTFTDPKKRSQRGGHVTPSDLRRYRFVKANDADFATYFLRFYHLPFTNLCSLSRKRLDFVIRFETLQEDFAKALELLAIEQKRPLPVANRTAGRTRDFWSYYTPQVRDRARRVFGPFMRIWGYEFPPEWGSSPIPWSSQALFHVVDVGKKLYWKHLKGGQSRFAQVIRALWFGSS